nr:MAG TPA: hypothetical protein [Caudoviricetes sp.]
MIIASTLSNLEINIEVEDSPPFLTYLVGIGNQRQQQ